LRPLLQLRIPLRPLARLHPPIPGQQHRARRAQGRRYTLPAILRTRLVLT
jgi:hypothetical protein